MVISTMYLGDVSLMSLPLRSILIGQPVAWRSKTCSSVAETSPKMKQSRESVCADNQATNMASRSISGPPFRAGVALRPGRFAYYHRLLRSRAMKKPSLPGSRISFTLRRHHPQVDLEAALAPVLDVALQGFVNDGEGQRVPGDVRMFEKLHLQAFNAGAEGGGAHLAADDHIDLADMRNAED